MPAFSLRRPRYADIVATLALVLAMGGTAYAVTSPPNNSVGTAQLKNSAVTNPKLAANAVGTGKIQMGSVTSGKIADGTIVGADIAADSIGLAQLVGTDVQGTISLNFNAGQCATFTIFVGGAQTGDLVVFNWAGDTFPPASLMIGPLKVSATNTVLVPMCNVGSSSFSQSNMHIRVVTFN